MVLIAEDFGADMRPVAFMQYLRVALLALTASIVARVFDMGAAGAVSLPSHGTQSWEAISLQVGRFMMILLFGPSLARFIAVHACGEASAGEPRIDKGFGQSSGRTRVFRRGRHPASAYVPVKE